MNFIERLFYVISLLILFSSCTEQEGDNNPWQYKNEGSDDIEIVREYVSPEEILWTSDDKGEYVQNQEYLLQPGNGQADLVGKRLCTMVGNEDNNPAVLFDFGRELNGGIEIVTGMFEGKEPINLRITFG